MEKRCIACDAALSKYKCPACLAFYCSIACCKQHKESPECSKRQQQALAARLAAGQTDQILAESNFGQSSSKRDDDDENEKLTPQQLTQLDQSEELKEVLANDDLKRVLSKIGAFKDPRQADREIRQLMNSNPDFLRFVDTCLEVVQPRNLADVVTKFSNN